VSVIFGFNGWSVLLRTKICIIRDLTIILEFLFYVFLLLLGSYILEIVWFSFGFGFGSFFLATSDL
jgi:hypothetical protein